jgi:hypothetical protein
MRSQSLAGAKMSFFDYFWGFGCVFCHIRKFELDIGSCRDYLESGNNKEKL